MGTVFRARDARTGLPVALKIVERALANARFEREARLLATLEHPSIVRCLRALRPGGYIVVSGNNDGAPPDLAALFRLRTAQWGGPVWSTSDAESALREAGFAEVRSLPTKPNALAAFVVGIKPR